MKKFKMIAIFAIGAVLAGCSTGLDGASDEEIGIVWDNADSGSDSGASVETPVATDSGTSSDSETPSTPSASADDETPSTPSVSLTDAVLLSSTSYVKVGIPISYSGSVMKIEWYEVSGSELNGDMDILVMLTAALNKHVAAGASQSVDSSGNIKLTFKGQSVTLGNTCEIGHGDITSDYYRIGSGSFAKSTSTYSIYDTSVGETASGGGTTTRMNVNKAGFEKESLAAYFTPPAGYEECRKITLGDAEVFFRVDDVSTFAWYAK